MSEKEMTIKKKLLADIDWNCAIPSLVIVALIALPAILFEEQTSTFVNNFFNTFVEATSAFYIVIPVFLIGIGLWMAFSKYGKVVLGDPKERPAISKLHLYRNADGHVLWCDHHAHWHHSMGIHRGGPSIWH